MHLTWIITWNNAKYESKTTVYTIKSMYGRLEDRIEGDMNKRLCLLWKTKTISLVHNILLGVS